MLCILGARRKGIFLVTLSCAESAKTVARVSRWTPQKRQDLTYRGHRQRTDPSIDGVNRADFLTALSDCGANLQDLATTRPAEVDFQRDGTRN